MLAVFGTTSVDSEFLYRAGGQSARRGGEGDTGSRGEGGGGGICLTLDSHDAREKEGSLVVKFRTTYGVHFRVMMYAQRRINMYFAFDTTGKQNALCLIVAAGLAHGLPCGPCVLLPHSELEKTRPSVYGALRLLGIPASRISFPVKARADSGVGSGNVPSVLFFFRRRERME